MPETRPRPTLPLLLVLVGLAGLPLSAQAQQPTSSARARTIESPQSVYEKGVRQMKRGLWDDAILSFEKVRNHFPFNQYSVLAELKIADCLYEKASYPDAVDAYRQFKRLHPRHPRIDYVVLRTAKSFFKLAPLIAQRDQANSRRGLKQLDGFEAKFPESEHIDEVLRVRSQTQTRLAKSILQVGDFYWKQRKWGAAERRYKQALENYPANKLGSRTRYRLGLSLWRQDRMDEARATLGALAASDPESRWGRLAVRWLDRNRPEAAPAAEVSGT